MIMTSRQEDLLNSIKPTNKESKSSLPSHVMPPSETTEYKTMLIEEWRESKEDGNWRVTGTTLSGERCCMWVRLDPKRLENEWLKPLIGITNIPIVVRLSFWDPNFECWKVLVMPILNQTKIFREMMEGMTKMSLMSMGSKVSSSTEKDTSKVQATTEVKPKQAKSKKPTTKGKVPEGRFTVPNQIHRQRIDEVAELMRVKTGMDKSSFQGECIWEGLLTVAKRHGLEL